MFGYYLRRVDQRCSPCEFEKNDAVISDLWHSVTHFGILWPSSTIPHESSFHFFSGCLRQSLNSIRMFPMSLSHAWARMEFEMRQYHAIVRYDPVRIWFVCIYAGHTVLVFLILGNLLTSWVPSFGWALLFLLPVAKWSHVSTEGPLISHHPTGRSLWTELF